MVNKAMFSRVGWVAGSLSAFAWSIFGVLLLPASDYISWVSYSTLLNIITALWVQHESGKGFTRIGWVLNCTVLGGVILGAGCGFFNSAQAIDFGSVALMSGLNSYSLLGGAFGALLGWASYLPKPPKSDFVHTLFYSTLRGTTLSVGLTIIYLACASSLYWLIQSQFAPNNLSDLALTLVGVSVFALLGGIPGLSASIFTAVLANLLSWWRSKIK